MSEIGLIGKKCPSVKNPKFFVKTFNTIQELIGKKQIIAGHDIGSGGLITTIMEMCFASVNIGAEIDISEIGDDDIIKKLFSENAGLVFQSVDDSIEINLIENSIEFYKIGEVVEGDNLYGDGVNIAARIEALAQPNGVCISRSVHEFINKKLEFLFNDLGEQTVKENKFHAFDVVIDDSQKRILKTKSNSKISIFVTILCLIILSRSFY